MRAWGVLSKYLLIVLTAFPFVACGTPDNEPTDSVQRGRWREYRTHRFDADLTQEQRETIERLESIGYLSGSRRAESRSLVRVHVPEKVHAGFNLYTSGHAPEAVLMDMEGNVLHRWYKEFYDVWPDYPISGNVPQIHFWRRAHLFENGDILAIYEGLGLLKLDRDSNVLWAKTYRAHHDLDVLPNGDILVLTREAHVVPDIDIPIPVVEDFVSLLSPNGEEKQRVSLLDCFEASEEHSWTTAYRKFWEKQYEREYDFERNDLFHTNSVQMLDGTIADRAPAFRKGNVLVSLGHMDVIAVVDLEARKVVWSLVGRTALQHDAKIIGGGELMLFDNLWRSSQSAVKVFDPVTNEVLWQYAGSPGAPFHSRACGAAERLGNGNTLITESDNGRAFEVTPEQEIVWEFYNPHRAGPNDEFIATLFEVVRLEPTFPVEWVQSPVRP